MVNGKLPFHMIYEDDDCLVILDKYPIDNAHSLIITKKHFEKIIDIFDDFSIEKLFLC